MNSKAMDKHNGNNTKIVDDFRTAPLISGLNKPMSSMLEFQPMTSPRFCCSSQAFNG